jgi:hypothetical protein
MKIIDMSQEGPAIVKTSRGLILIPSPRSKFQATHFAGILEFLGQLAASAIGDLFSTWVASKIPDLQAALHQAVDEICDTIYAVGHQNLIASELFTANNYLSKVTDGLAKCSLLSAEGQRMTLEALELNGNFSDAANSFMQLSADYDEMGIASVAAVATTHVKCQRRLLKLHSPVMSDSLAQRTIDQYQGYLADSAARLRSFIPDGIKVGAYVTGSGENQDNHPATNPGEPNSPEDRDWSQFWCFRLNMTADMTAWLQRPDPSRLDNRVWIAGGENYLLRPATANADAKEVITSLRAQEKALETQLTEQLDQGVLVGVTKVRDALPHITGD